MAFLGDFVYFLDRHYKDEFVCEHLKPAFQRQLAELYKDFRSANFFSMEDKDIDPFPGGEYRFVEKHDEKEK